MTLNWEAPPNLKFDAKGTLHARDATIGWEKAQAQGVQAAAQLDGLHPLRGRIQPLPRSAANWRPAPNWPILTSIWR